jgi:N-acetylmuramoyl-L-alanine amidase
MVAGGRFEEHEGGRHMSDPSTSPTVLREGDRGPLVAEVRSRLADLRLPSPDAADPAFFDAGLGRAVRAFQQQRGLSVDGTVGGATYRALEEARWRLGDRLLSHQAGSIVSGDDVVALQLRLLDLGFKVGRVDGRFGPRTEQAVQDFQRNVGVPADGTCGPATFKALARLAPRVSGGRPNAMRAQERIRRAGPQLPGKTVVIDPVAGPATDPELRALAGAVTSDLARRVEGRLVALGVQAFLTNPGGADPSTEADRAEFANRAGADVCISLQADASDNPDASGVATYFFGLDAHGVRSWAGERFAGLVRREIVARTGMVDLRTHPKTWDLLRRTRMPAVRIDVGYVSNPGDAARLADPAVRDLIAEAIVVAVQRVYLTPEVDPNTGVLRLDELRGAATGGTGGRGARPAAPA